MKLEPDIDSAAIAFARRGLYPPAALQKVPAALRDRYFVKNDGGYEVTKSIRAIMIFGEHDLGAHGGVGILDRRQKRASACSTCSTARRRAAASW